MMEKVRNLGLATAMIAAAVVLSSCKSNEQTAQTTAPEQPKAEAPAQPAAPPPAEAPPETAPTKQAEAPHNYSKELLAPAKLKEKAPETYKIRFDTTRGVFTVTVNRSWSPLGADRL